MIADIDTQITKLQTLRQNLIDAGTMIQDTLARGQEVAQEITTLRQTLLAEDTAPLDAGTRMAVVDVLRERRNRQEAGAARLVALCQELAARRSEIIELLLGRNDG